MPLTREQQRNILKSHNFHEYQISNDRYNYKFNGMVIAHQLDHNGNGYVWGNELDHSIYMIDNRGWINIKILDEVEINDLINEAKKQTKFQ
jgi:hypothetical protein